MRFLGILAGTLLLTSCAATTPDTLDVEESLAYCDRQVKRTLRELTVNDSIDHTMMPRNIAATDSVWHLRKATPDEWCAGFWPGVLWYNYESTHDEIMREEA